MKKRALAITVIWLLCACFAMSAFAIDTPWIPIKPDGSTTESSSPTHENSDTIDAENGGGSSADVKNDEETETNAWPSDTEGSKETDPKHVDSTDQELSKKTGCGSVLGGYAVLACCLTASVCVVKMRKENE